MKFCEKCKKTYPDDQAFCSDCGNKLTDYATTPTVVNNSTTPVVNNNGSNATLNLWLPVIIAGLGAVIGWFLSGLFGFILGAAGVGLAVKQKKEGQSEQTQYILTWVLGVIDFVFWIIAMSA